MYLFLRTVLWYIFALKAAEELEKEGISLEVVDLRTVQPLDIETIIASVEKTGRAIVVQEAQKTSWYCDKRCSGN